jgi:hypothetical protein
VDRTASPVVVGADLQPDDPIDHVAGRYDHDAHLVVFREALDWPIFPPKANIEQHDIGHAFAQRCAHRLAAISLTSLVAVFGKVLGNHFAHARVVVHDQYASAA